MATSKQSPPVNQWLMNSVHKTHLLIIIVKKVTKFEIYHTPLILFLLSSCVIDTFDLFILKYT